MSGWDDEFYAADVYMAYLHEVTTDEFEVEPRSSLFHVAHGLEGWDERLAQRHSGRGREIRVYEWYPWTVSAFSATAHDIITEALDGVDLNQYDPESSRQIECAHQVVQRVVVAWRVLITDLIELRDAGQIQSFADWRSLAEQASGAIEMARNATLAAYRF